MVHTGGASVVLTLGSGQGGAIVVLTLGSSTSGQGGASVVLALVQLDIYRCLAVSRLASAGHLPMLGYVAVS